MIKLFIFLLFHVFCYSLGVTTPKLDRNSQKLAVCNGALSTAALKKMQSIMNLETKEKIGIFVMKFNFTVYEILAPRSQNT